MPETNGILNTIPNGAVPRVPKFTTPVTLEPVTFTPEEVKELLVQRRICGWNYELHNVEEWRQSMDRKEMTLFWIVIDGRHADAAGIESSTTSTENEHSVQHDSSGVQTPSHSSTTTSDTTSSSSTPSNTSNTTTTPTTTSIRAGHVALASQSHPPHPLLARPDKSILTISTFFIHPLYRSLGLGRTTLDLLEPMASQLPYGSPNCREICVDTMSAKYVEDVDGNGGREWEAIRENAKMSPYSKQRWYERRGYVVFHEEKRYQDRGKKGEVVWIDAVFLRKVL